MKKSISIIGAGPSSLMLAAALDKKKFDITIYERNTAPARKFLVAGKGGFNLTHSENIVSFIQRYTPSSFLSTSIQDFNNQDLQNFLQKIGIQTYTGSSKRIFPAKGIKPISVLNAFLKKLNENNVHIKTQYEWVGWTSDNHILFNTPDKKIVVKSDFTVFALGGASWKVTGSDGKWTDLFSEKNISILPFHSSNCAYQVQWPAAFIERAEGKLLKNISIKCDSNEKKGELVITRFGLEGGAIYSLSPEIRNELKKTNQATVFIDLKPLSKHEDILNALKQKGNKSIRKVSENAINLSSLQFELVKSILSKDEFTDPDILSLKIKQLPISITGCSPIDEAISTVGGISLNEVNEHFELKKLSGHFVIGEMLDWDAPTGGYLLQACFSMGHYLAKYLNKLS